MVACFAVTPRPTHLQEFSEGAVPPCGERYRPVVAPGGNSPSYMHACMHACMHPSIHRTMRVVWSPDMYPYLKYLISISICLSPSNIVNAFCSNLCRDKGTHNLSVRIYSRRAGIDHTARDTCPARVLAPRQVVRTEHSSTVCTSINNTVHNVNSRRIPGIVLYLYIVEVYYIPDPCT